MINKNLLLKGYIRFSIIFLLIVQLVLFFYILGNFQTIFNNLELLKFFVLLYLCLALFLWSEECTLDNIFYKNLCMNKVYLKSIFFIHF